ATSLSGDAAEPAGDLRTVTIAAVGDTMVGSVFPSRNALPPESGRRVFERVRDLWSGADIVTGNLEGTISSDPSAARALGKNSYRFLMPAESLAIYRDAGFNRQMGRRDRSSAWRTTTPWTRALPDARPPSKPWTRQASRTREAWPGRRPSSRRRAA
ncbi:hypothetical protein EG835_10065, partial [bacterium]|nr:hypothetical protein [bacterium]